MGYRRSLVDTCKSSSVLVVSTLVAFMYLFLVFAINRLCNDELSLLHIMTRYDSWPRGKMGVSAISWSQALHKERLGTRLRSGLEHGVWCIADHCPCHRAAQPMGLWQLWTSNLALILLTASCSECWLQWWPCIRDIWRKPTDSGTTRYAYCTLLAN